MKIKKLSKFEKELICENLDYSKEIDNEKVSIIYKGGKLVYKIKDMKSSIFSQAQMDFLLNNFATKKEFNELKSKVEVIEKDVAILKDDVAILKQDMVEVKIRITNLENDVAILKSDMAEVKIKVNGIFYMLKTLIDKK